MDCEILLLTEVSEDVDLPGYHLHRTAGLMAPGRSWAAVASRASVRALPDPHGASAAVITYELRVCSSILPWRSCGREAPWAGETQAEKTKAAVGAIEGGAPDVWGGDWNHALTGREYSGALEGRESIEAAFGRLRLVAPTASLPHQIAGLLTIDHVAVPAAWKVERTEQVPAHVSGAWISDHDAYVVDVGF
jgi:hypothetical protein